MAHRLQRYKIIKKQLFRNADKTAALIKSENKLTKDALRLLKQRNEYRKKRKFKPLLRANLRPFNYTPNIYSITHRHIAKSRKRILGRFSIVRKRQLMLIPTEKNKDITQLPTNKHTKNDNKLINGETIKLKKLSNETQKIGKTLKNYAIAPQEFLIKQNCPNLNKKLIHKLALMKTKNSISHNTDNGKNKAIFKKCFKFQINDAIKKNIIINAHKKIINSLLINNFRKNSKLPAT